jgi:hypothetical protein
MTGRALSCGRCISCRSRSEIICRRYWNEIFGLKAWTKLINFLAWCSMYEFSSLSLGSWWPCWCMLTSVDCWNCTHLGTVCLPCVCCVLLLDRSVSLYSSQLRDRLPRRPKTELRLPHFAGVGDEAGMFCKIDIVHGPSRCSLFTFYSLHSLHVLATLSHLQVLGPKSFTLHFLVFAFKTWFYIKFIKYKIMWL